MKIKSISNDIAKRRGFEFVQSLGNANVYKDVNDIYLGIEKNNFKFMYYTDESHKYCIKSTWFYDIFDSDEEFSKYYQEFRELAETIKWRDDL